MKSLKKKFGKFAISHSKAIKINGGDGSCECSRVSCESPLAPGTVGFVDAPTPCQSVCCTGDSGLFPMPCFTTSSGTYCP